MKVRITQLVQTAWKEPARYRAEYDIRFGVYDSLRIYHDSERSLTAIKYTLHVVHVIAISYFVVFNMIGRTPHAIHFLAPSQAALHTQSTPPLHSLHALYAATPGYAAIPEHVTPPR